MPIYWDAKRKRWGFEFDRLVDGRRFRKRRLLPAGWGRTQADAFDRKESAALYAVATGIAKPRRTVDEAVDRYQLERLPQLKHGANVERELAATRDWWTGRPIEDLPAICAEYAADQRGALQPATIKNRLAYLRSACRWAWKHHALTDTDPGARVVMPEVRNARTTIGQPRGTARPGLAVRLQSRPSGAAVPVVLRSAARRAEARRARARGIRAARHQEQRPPRGADPPAHPRRRAGAGAAAR